MWKKIRILILLAILLVVLANTWRDQNQDWNKPVVVLLHPINADGQSSTQKYIDQLSADHFSKISTYLQQSGQQFRGQPTYIYVKLGRTLTQIPPQVPQNGSILSAMLWSLKFRYYAWKHHESSDGRPSVTLYLNYYDPSLTPSLKHSTALEKGRIGSVNLFANKQQSKSNNVVLTHELLHTFGASDKYDLATGQPIYPIGYADPNQQPLYPQKRAELMGGYLAKSATQSETPASLDQTMIGEITAKEMGWLK